MYSMLITAVGLLQLTSAAFVPNSGASLAERATIGKGVFKKPPQFLRQTGLDYGAGSEPFNFEQQDAFGASGYTRDVPLVIYSLTKGVQDVKVQLVRPARRKSSSDKQGYVDGELEGTVHDVVGLVKQINVLKIGGRTILPVEQLQTGMLIPNGKFHVTISGQQSSGSALNTGRWISPLFEVKKGPNYLSPTPVPVLPTASSFKKPESTCQCTCDPKQGSTSAPIDVRDRVVWP